MKRIFLRMLSLIPAGSRPGGRLHFLCVAKENGGKERQPDSSALRARCVARAKREAQKLALRAQTSALLFPLVPALLAFSLRQKSEQPKPEQPNSNQDAPRRVLIDFGLGLRGLVFGIQRRYEETSSAGLDGSGLALSERSEFSQIEQGFLGSDTNFAAALCAAPCGRAERLGDFGL
jgi:hypothetical protein